MTVRLVVSLAVGLLLVAGGASAITAGPSSLPPGATPPAATNETGEDGRAVLGREGGYRFDETLDVDQSDGLNGSELDAILARTMARVEYIRRMEFAGDLRFEVVDRATFRQRERNRSAPGALSRFDNAKFEALFLVNESADSIAVQRRNQGGSVQGYYDPDAERIVLVSEAGERPRIDERTLAHELVHALQDQHFGLEDFEARTRDRRNAQDALIEGDAGLVEYRYRTRCADRWGCLTAERGESEVANLGVYLVTFFPYSDGPPFVRHFYERGGWATVNGLYDDPPESSEQVIHPESYDSDVPASLSDAELPIGSTPTLPTTNGTATPPVMTPTPPVATHTPGTARNATPTSLNGTPTPPNATPTLNATPTPNATAPQAGTATPTGIQTGTVTPTETSTPTATVASVATPTPNVTVGTPFPTTARANGTGNGTATERPSTNETTTVPTARRDRNGTPGIPTPTNPRTRTVETPAGDAPSTGGSTATSRDAGRAAWERVRPAGRPDYATLGEAAIASMFAYPTYHSGGETGVVSGDAFVNLEGDEVARFDPYDYDLPYSEGWDGDRLQVYRRGNETAYVWRIAWDSTRDAREFLRGYRQVLAYWGGKRVGENVYRIAEGGFADAFLVSAEDDHVTIVNAPTLDALSALAGIGGVTPGTSAKLTVSGGAFDEASPISAVQPGFGPVTALAAFGLATLLLARRRGDVEPSSDGSENS